MFMGGGSRQVASPEPELEANVGTEFELKKDSPSGRPDVAVFHPSGWLDAQSEGQLVDAVQQAKAEGAAYVVLDLREVDTITSAGIRAIQKANQILSGTGATGQAARVKLCNTPPRIYEVLSMVGLLQAVPTYEGVDIAIAACQK